jgi:hypothetical protein
VDLNRGTSLRTGRWPRKWDSISTAPSRVAHRSADTLPCLQPTNALYASRSAILSASVVHGRSERN